MNFEKDSGKLTSIIESKNRFCSIPTRFHILMGGFPDAEEPAATAPPTATALLIRRGALTTDIAVVTTFAGVLKVGERRSSES